MTTRARADLKEVVAESPQPIIEKPKEKASPQPTVTEKAQTPRSIVQEEPGEKQTAAEQEQSKEEQAGEPGNVTPQIKPPKVKPPKAEEARPPTPPTPSSTSTASKPFVPIPKKPSEEERKALRELLEQQAAAEENLSKQVANITPPKVEERPLAHLLLQALYLSLFLHQA